MCMLGVGILLSQRRITRMAPLMTFQRTARNGHFARKIARLTPIAKPRSNFMPTGPASRMSM